VSSEDVETGAQEELPWFLPPVAAAKVDQSQPISLSAYYARTSIGGDFDASSGELGIVAQTARWLSLGVGVNAIEGTLNDSEAMMPPLKFESTRLFALRFDVARYAGYEVYHEDKLRLFVLIPSLTFNFATNNLWEDPGLTTFALQVRPVGARVQICPGIHIDLSGPIYSKWVGTVSVPASSAPFAETSTYVATGSGWGVELEVGYTFWSKK
jgi:hypothetical protein